MAFGITLGFSLLYAIDHCLYASRLRCALRDILRHARLKRSTQDFRGRVALAFHSIPAKGQEVEQVRMQFKVRTSLVTIIEKIADHVMQDLDDWFHTHGAQEASHQNMAPQEPEAAEDEPINAHFPTVIFFEGRWVELHCKTCGANATRKGKASSRVLTPSTCMQKATTIRTSPSTPFCPIAASAY